MVRIWTWLVNYVFKYRRVTIYLTSGRTIKLCRPEDVTIDATYRNFKEWLSGNDGRYLQMEDAKDARRVIVRAGDIRAVDIR